MNRPDEKKLTEWLEGNLEGDELHDMEAWAETHAGELDAEFKCNIGWDALSDEMMSSLPAETEPPYPEFFNSKLEQAILKESELVTPVGNTTPTESLWHKLRAMVVPAAIAALLAFYAGTQMQSPEKGEDVMATDFNRSNVYVPQEGVVAAVSEMSGSTEIILDGLTPISDELDIVTGEGISDDSSMMATTEEKVVPYTFF